MCRSCQLSVREFEQCQELDAEIVEANQHQKLRRQLLVFSEEQQNRCRSNCRSNIDQDLAGDNQYSNRQDFACKRQPTGVIDGAGEIITTSQVLSGEYTWRLNGMSWLKNPPTSAR